MLALLSSIAQPVWGSLHVAKPHMLARMTARTRLVVQGYGSKGIAEIPGNATLELDVELLSVKTSPFGSRVKVIEG